MKTYYLGPKGSYSYLLAKQVYDEKKLIPCDSFSQMHKSLLTNKNTRALLPLENSITSDVHQNVDFLFENKLNITNEFYLKITLNLIGIKSAHLADIKKAYSHPKALAQVTRFLSKKAIKPLETESTSAAQEKILRYNKKNLGAIGSSHLIDKEGLIFLQKDIGNERNNLTRFVEVNTKKVSKNKGAEKMTVVFAIPHKIGSLAKLLKKLSEFGANLTKIESRPIPGKDWEYLFWVDLVYNKNQREKILLILQKNTKKFRISGFYKKGKTYTS